MNTLKAASALDFVARINRDGNVNIHMPDLVKACPAMVDGLKLGEEILEALNVTETDMEEKLSNELMLKSVQTCAFKSETKYLRPLNGAEERPCHIDHFQKWLLKAALNYDIDNKTDKRAAQTPPTSNVQSDERAAPALPTSDVESKEINEPNANAEPQVSGGESKEINEPLEPQFLSGSDRSGPVLSSLMLAILIFALL